MSSESISADPPQHPDIDYRVAYNDLVHSLRVFYNDEASAFKHHWDAHEAVIDGRPENRVIPSMNRDRGRLEGKRDALHSLAAFVITATEADGDLYRLVESGK